MAHPKARRILSQEEKVTVLDAYITNISEYRQKKRAGKTKRFHDDMASQLGLMPGGSENLLKNLGRDYREEVRKTMLSGRETEGPSSIRGSEVLFLKYEEYYSLYFPGGGTLNPEVVVTEGGVKRRGDEPSTSSETTCGEESAVQQTREPRKKAKSTQEEMVEVMRQQITAVNNLTKEISGIREIMAGNVQINLFE